jgi:integrase
MGKRVNGEGSIYFVKGRGHRASLVVGKKPDGTLDRRSKTFELRGDASRWLRTQLDNEDKGIATAPDKLTVAIYAKEWLRDVIEPMGQPNTFEYYEYPVRCHITPAIGNIRLNDLRREHISKMLNERREQYSRRTVEVIHKTIKLILDWGIQGRLLERNVAKLVKTNDAKQVQEEQLNFDTLDGQQTARLVETIEKHPWRCFIMMALLLGIRRGELLAIRWQEIDLDGGWLKLRNSIIRVRVKRLKEQPTKRFSGAGSRLAPLKTPKSKRTLELPSLLLDELRAHRAKQIAERKKAGDKWREQDFVFASGQGDHWHPCTATNIYADVRLLADLPITTSLHDLRHSFASAMLSKGIHPKLVQEQLGHARFQITMDKYSHLMPGVKTGLPDVMDAFIADGKRALEAKRAAGEAPARRVQ